MRCLIVGDAHLHEGENLDDVERCLAFAVQTAGEQWADLAVFLGDQFDHKSTPAERLMLRDVLLDMPCPSVLIRGNHDAIGDLAVFAGYPDVEVHEQPIVLEYADADLLVMPWPEKAWLAAQGLAGEAGDKAGARALGSLMQVLASTRKDRSKPLVIVGHLAIGGAQSSSGQPLIGRGLEVSIGDLVDTGACCTVLGHIHLPQSVAPSVHYAGSVSIVDFGEEGEGKRIGLLDITRAGIPDLRWFPTPCRKWVTVEACLEEPDANGSGGGLLLERFPGKAWADAVDGAEFGGANLRYRYRCAEAEQHLFNHEAIRARFAEAHSLKIVPEVERTARVRAADVSEAKTPEAKLIAWGAATDSEITPALLTKLHTIQEESHG